MLTIVAAAFVFGMLKPRSTTSVPATARTVKSFFVLRARMVPPGRGRDTTPKDDDSRSERFG